MVSGVRVGDNKLIFSTSLLLYLCVGKEEVRARDLFYGLWIPDLFMERVQADGDWALMCPAECPGRCWVYVMCTLFVDICFRSNIFIYTVVN